jgi:S1-C subfamily serine protease
MNLLDLVILALIVSAVIGGYRLGFLARAISWVGLVVGILLAAKYLPSIVDRMRDAPPANQFLVEAGVVVGAAFVGQAIGLIAGAALHRALPIGPLRQVDRVAGAVAGFLGVLVAVWLLLPSMAAARGWPAREARGSRVARAIDSVFPARPKSIQALERTLGDTFPKVLRGLQAAPNAGPPPAASGLSGAVVSSVSQSTVKVEGVACRRIQDGSGFAIGADRVVTNAHVVAGERSTSVIRPDGTRLRATVVLFDSDRDVAVLHVAGLDQTGLTMGTGKPGDTGAVFGHPQGQAQLAVTPAAIRQQIKAIGRDLYDTHDTVRQVFVLASDLQPGDSGGALVDVGGRVVGVAFAIAPDRPGTAYALTAGEVQPDLRADAGAPVSTGPCLREG